MTCDCQDPIVFGHHHQPPIPTYTPTPTPQPGHLTEYLYHAYHNRPHTGHLHWVMDHYWYNEIRYQFGTPHNLATDTITPDLLFALPITVTTNGGIPHLEIT